MRTLLPLLFLALFALSGCRTKPDTAQDTGDPTVIDSATPDSDTPGVDADDDGWIDELDCDDGDAAVNPDATEACNGVDDDCDGLVDDDDTDVDGQSTWWLDGDSDGHGGTAWSEDACEQPEGFTESSDDCDDADDGTHPDANEACDEDDNDCDGAIDENSTDAGTWHTDADGDGYGDPALYTQACEGDGDQVADATDCDDADGAVSPGADEACNGIDDDCDGLVDDDDSDLDDPETFYVDSDGDGFGDPELPVQACDAPSDAVRDDTDCDDRDAGVNPDAAELCNDTDDDCDGLVDSDDPDLADGEIWFIDVDGDGYGSADYTASACDAPSGYVDNAQDCDDGHAEASPDGSETCDGLDNDCDGSTDEGVESTWYTDADGDGHGDPDAPVTGCSEPSGAVPDATDCDDSDSAVHPDATELCNGTDDDCSGETDEDSAADAETWYADSDSDGYGDPASTTTACSVPSGHVDDDQDCDDGDASVHPDTLWYLDYDGDGYGDTTLTLAACEAPSGFVDDTTDCDDLDADVNPGATELCSGVDDDCDGLVDGDDPDLPGGSLATWYTDADGDGYGDPDLSQDACSQPSGAVSDDTDCDDSAADANPGGTETCDSLDNDCDGTTDNDADVLGDAGCPGLSCADILDRRPAASDGTWSIDPASAGAYDVDCDMTSEDGGWTFIANLSDSGTDVWSEFMPEQDAGLWDSTDTLGTSISFTQDYKSQAYVDMGSTQLLIKEAGTNVLITQEDCWTEQPFVDFISALSWSGDASDYDWSDSTGAWLCSFEHFGIDDTVLRAASHSGAELEVGFKWGERDGQQDGNKDRTMITTSKANGYAYDHHVDLPTGLGGFTSYSGSENYEDVNECQGDGPDQCTNADQDYQLYVR